jgi:hypothetical protein
MEKKRYLKRTLVEFETFAKNDGIEFVEPNKLFA